LALLDILHFPNPLLRKKCTKITEVNKDLYRLADDMCETLDYHKGLGLAGNQVGYLKRIIVIKLPEENEYKILINPEITETYGNREVEEGCLSVPGYKGLVNRSLWIKAKGLDMKMRKWKIKTDGLLAQVLEHEIDHLNGIMYFDHLISHSKGDWHSGLVKLDEEKLDEN
tara:strand:- start:704 stop:1213 length:510 start_codon:yes stop_codon:yes gene_type:complete